MLSYTDISICSRICRFISTIFFFFPAVDSSFHLIGFFVSSPIGCYLAFPFLIFSTPFLFFHTDLAANWLFDLSELFRVFYSDFFSFFISCFSFFVVPFFVIYLLVVAWTLLLAPLHFARCNGFIPEENFPLPLEWASRHKGPFRFLLSPTLQCHLPDRRELQRLDSRSVCAWTLCTEYIRPDGILGPTGVSIQWTVKGFIKNLSFFR